jgi:hypothetical protein
VNDDQALSGLGYGGGQAVDLTLEFVYHLGAACEPFPFVRSPPVDGGGEPIEEKGTTDRVAA